MIVIFKFGWFSPGGKLARHFSKGRHESVPDKYRDDIPSTAKIVEPDEEVEPPKAEDPVLADEDIGVAAAKAVQQAYEEAEETADANLEARKPASQRQKEFADALAREEGEADPKPKPASRRSRRGGKKEA